MERKHTIAVILAAGQGKRMNSNVPKQYLLLQEKPILYYTIKAFEESFIDEIILVVGENEETFCRENFVVKYGFGKVSAIVTGGKERYHSVYSALSFIEKTHKEESYVFIHDGARPFVFTDVLERAYKTVIEKGACIVGVPVKDTIKVVAEDGCVLDTPNRSTLWAIQTPQVFKFLQIKKAYDKMMEREKQGVLNVSITDDAMVMETFGDIPVCVVEGAYENIKITTPDDMIVAERILKKS